MRKIVLAPMVLEGLKLPPEMSTLHTISFGGKMLKPPYCFFRVFLKEDARYTLWKKVIVVVCMELVVF